MTARPPDRPSVFIGVDAGGSHTTAVVADHTLRVLARESGAAGALRPGGADASAQVIGQVARKALAAAGISGPATSLVVGAAGTGREEERAALEKALAALKLATQVAVTTDAAIALQAAFHDGSGIIVMSGSGSIGYARDRAGVVWRVGGLGWQLGDEGSGYALARAALSAVGKAADGRGPETGLTDALSEATGANTLDDLVRWAQTADRAAVAALASTVAEVSASGDPIAVKLIESCATDLGDHVAALLHRFPGERRVSVALAGGLLTPDSPVRASLLARLRRVLPSVAVSQSVVDAPLGAVELAVKRAAT